MTKEEWEQLKASCTPFQWELLQELRKIRTVLENELPMEFK